MAHHLKGAVLNDTYFQLGTVSQNFRHGGIVVKHADSQHRGCQLDPSMCHFYNTISFKEGALQQAVFKGPPIKIFNYNLRTSKTLKKSNGVPPREFHVPGKISDLCLWFLLRSKSSMQRRPILSCQYLSQEGSSLASILRKKL